MVRPEDRQDNETHEQSPSQSDELSTPHRMRNSIVKEAREQSSRGMHAAGSQVGDIADSFHDAGRSLEQDRHEILGGGMHTVARQLEKLSSYLRSQEPNDMMHDASDYVRRHPEFVLGAAVASGLLLGRFLRSSSHRESIDREVESTATLRRDQSITSPDIARPSQPRSGFGSGNSPMPGSPPLPQSPLADM